MKRSPLFCETARLDPSLVGIQGWEVPNEFSSAAEEHRAVRERVGLLDWSTTGEFEIVGPDALAVVQGLIVNDASRMPVNRVLYTSILDEDGGMMSDITVYRLAEERYMLMTAWGSNAAGERPEYELLVEHSRGQNAWVFDASPGVCLVALQGPRSRELLSELTDADLGGLAYMWALPAQIGGFRALIGRTGYTGELGYEILVPVEHAHDFWTAIMEAGEKYGLAPCGMIAAFSLRMEKGYIMRFDFAGGRTPYELGLGWTVKPDKGDFIGREALLRRKEAGFDEKLVLLAVKDGHVPSGGDLVLQGGNQVGAVTSAAYGYTLGVGLALAYLPLPLATEGTEVVVQDQDGKTHPAAVGQRSPYDPEGARLRV